MMHCLPLAFGKKYVFIDALCIEAFRQVDASLLQNTSLLALRAVLFPYMGDPYAVIESTRQDFDLSRITYFSDPDATSQEPNQFCSDTGDILVVDEDIFVAVTREFDQDAFIDWLEDPTLRNHWARLLDQYPQQLFCFTTGEIKEAYAGGGNFQIE
jgi:hypothetical protein